MSCCRGQTLKAPEHVVKVEQLAKPPEKLKTGQFTSSVERPKIILKPRILPHP